MNKLRILVITSEWPTEDQPNNVPFLVNEINHLRNHGIEIEVFPFTGKKNPLIYLREWINLRKKYDISQFDLIHAQWGQSALLALPKSLPLVVTFRGSDLEGIVNERGRYTLSGRILRFISQRIAKIADHVIIVSESLAKYLPLHKYSVLPVCLDTSIFKPMDRDDARKELGLSPYDKLVLFPSNPNRPEKRYLLAKASVALLDKNVKLLTVFDVPHEKMMLYYNASDTLLITSTHEGSPTVMYEALACNLPIVSVDVGDVRQRIEGLEGCYICEVDAPEALANYIKKVLITKNRLVEYSRMEKHNVNTFCESIKKIYESCL